MAIIKAVNSKASIGRGIQYILKEGKTKENLIAGKDCNPVTAIDEMKAIKELHNKTGGRQYKHYIMSFHPDDPDMTQERAHQVGVQFMEKEERFKNFQVVMATHIDKGHIHNHFIVNSVNMTNGKKYRESKYDLEKLKDHLRELEQEYEITPDLKSDEPGKISSLNHNKYRAIKRAAEGKYQSYILDIAIAVKETKGDAVSKEDFMEKMTEKGYRTNWTDTRKHVTFINQETGRRVRLANLEKTFNDPDFTKEGLTNEFKRNHGEREAREAITGERSARIERTDERDPQIERANEELYSSRDGQGDDEPADRIERDGSDRKDEQTGTGSDAFDFTAAEEQLRRSTKANARGVGRLSQPDARTRAIEQEKARAAERANRREHERRTEPGREKDRGPSR